jgi:mannose-6-phosphate isomerase
MLTYTFGPSESQLMKPCPFKSTRHTTLYDPPIEEFSVLLVDVPEGSGEKEIHPPIQGPSIVIVTGLKNKNAGAKIGWRGGEVQVEREGQAFFVGSGEEVSFGGGLVAYRAFVEVP